MFKEINEINEIEIKTLNMRFSKTEFDGETMINVFFSAQGMLPVVCCSVFYTYKGYTKTLQEVYEALVDSMAKCRHGNAVVHKLIKKELNSGCTRMRSEYVEFVIKEF